MQMRLELDDGGEIAGTLTGPDGVAVAFVGRLGLLSALERVLARAAADLNVSSSPAD